jgi:hypothetical protein
MFQVALYVNRGISLVQKERPAEMTNAVSGDPDDLCIDGRPERK